MTANAWGEEPSSSVRFHRNNVRVSITPPAGSEPFHVACGLFRTYERGGGADDHKDLQSFASHDVASMEAALQIAHAALERCAYVWDLPTYEVVERAAVQR